MEKGITTSEPILLSHLVPPRATRPNLSPILRETTVSYVGLSPSLQRLDTIRIRVAPTLELGPLNCLQSDQWSLAEFCSKTRWNERWDLGRSLAPLRWTAPKSSSFS